MEMDFKPTLGIEKFARDIGFETFTFDWLTTPGMSIYTIVIAGFGNLLVLLWLFF